jgi:hypothetical protein
MTAKKFNYALYLALALKIVYFYAQKCHNSVYYL